MSSLKGVRCVSQEYHVVFYVDDFSEEMKNIFRTQLSYICHGASKASRSRKKYNYKNTVKAFIKRYEGKPDSTKIGMMGELLTHIFIIQFLPEFNTISPFFNMEEKSITKGFDVLLYSSSNNEVWITEVKSGELHKGKDSNETNKILLSTAKFDLKGRLNQNEDSLWDNAINKATLALENKKDTKDAVLEILEEIGDEITEQQATSGDKNVILVSNLFANLNDEIQEHVLDNFYKKTMDESLFNKLFVISLQKNTYRKIYQFLKDEEKS
ncbi:phosphate ABC transporter substrate-binding protein [Shouchella clausii]|uniref:Anti-bacteriophage protein A/HamA C-terminal domain-containing protein n=1 Tax=Shouchella clausii TaxID=79880 RepID=A0A268NV02_SHOCL|nr:phosphate ABC transporter substrate-binding protein [Shouchella clausii]PAE87221.1 hypothetical protein CHH72_19660 [Shouchella clausii]